MVILDDNEKKAVLAHYLFHKGINVKDLISLTNICATKNENDAESFSAEYLIHDKEFFEFAGYTDIEVASTLDLPVDLVRLKFKNFDKSKL